MAILQNHSSGKATNSPQAWKDAFAEELSRIEKRHDFRAMQTVLNALMTKDPYLVWKTLHKDLGWSDNEAHHVAHKCWLISEPNVSERKIRSSIGGAFAEDIINHKHNILDIENREAMFEEAFRGEFNKVRIGKKAKLLETFIINGPETEKEIKKILGTKEGKKTWTKFCFIKQNESADNIRAFYKTPAAAEDVIKHKQRINEYIHPRQRKDSCHEIYR